MSTTRAEGFSCPYCMTYNDLEVDEQNDVGQQQIVDCQICCQPIELIITDDEFGLRIEARQENE